jgi:myosin heavy subunit
MDAMAQQLQESSDALTDLVQRQEVIVQETQRIDQETLQQLNEAQQRVFEARKSQFAQELSELTKMAWDVARRARQQPELGPNFQRAYQQLLQHFQAIQKALEAHDLPQAQQDLEAAQEQLTSMQQQTARGEASDEVTQRRTAQALERLQALQQQLQSLPQEREAMLTPTQRGQLGQTGEQQGAVREDTEALQQAFQDLLPLMPFLPMEMGKNLQEAVPFMQQAEGELAGHRSQQALPPEQEALEHLRSAQNGLQQALQQMAQRGQMMGMSMPMLRQAGRLPLPNAMPQPQVDQQQAGVAGANVRNFQLPDKEAYKVPRMFREDIVEALKEGYPARYKELIEQYYRNIVR